jgi:hypothetical protein
MLIHIDAEILQESGAVKVLIVVVGIQQGLFGEAINLNVHAFLDCTCTPLLCIIRVQLDVQEFEEQWLASNQSFHHHKHV